MLDLAALAAELTNDPLGRGYASMGDAACAESLNTEDRPAIAFHITGNDLQNSVIAWTEVEALTTAKRDTLMAILRSERLDISAGSKTQIYLNGVLGATGKAALAALSAPPISRAVELGFGAVAHWEVAEARRGNN